MLELFSASAYSLNMKSIQSAPPLNNLFETHDPAPQITTKSEYGIKLNEYN